MAHDSRAVANYILDMAEEKGMRLTLMQLIKLVYLADGWWLAFTKGESLTHDRPHAWQYGPVQPKLYKAFRGVGARPIEGKAFDRQTGLPFQSDFSDDERELIDNVLDSYGKLSAFALSNMTHQPETPWSLTYDSEGAYSEIPKDLIMRHFIDLKEQRSNS